MVTLQAREMGDKAWRELLQAHDATVRRMKSREFIGGLGRNFRHSERRWNTQSELKRKKATW
jgi:hypothetical protein